MSSRASTTPAPYPVRDAQLAGQADRDLTRRAIHGTWVSLFIFLVLATCTSYFQEHPRLAFSFAAIAALIIALRLGLHRWPNRPDSRSRTLWKKLYFSTIILLGLCWGVFYGVTVYVYGYGHWTTLVLLVCVIGVVSGASTSFAPNLAIM